MIVLTKYLLNKLSDWESVERLEVSHTLSSVPLFVWSFAGVVWGRGDDILLSESDSIYVIPDWEASYPPW